MIRETWKKPHSLQVECNFSSSESAVSLMIICFMSMVGSSGRGVLAERIGDCGSSRIKGCGTAGMGSLMSSWTLCTGAARKLGNCVDAIVNWPNFSDLLNHLKVGIYKANILKEKKKKKKKTKPKAATTIEPCQTTVIHVITSRLLQNITRSIRCCLDIFTIFKNRNRRVLWDLFYKGNNFSENY